MQAWLSGIERQVVSLVGDNTTAIAATGAAAFDPAVFSRMEWDDPRQPGAVISQPIEPLIGHFRHPLGPQCITNSSVHIESR